MKNHKRVIDILSSAAIDYRGLVLEIAKANPGALIRAQLSLDDGNNPWRRNVDDLLRTNNYVPAIKAVREATEWDLKRAKDYCDDRRKVLGVVVAA